MMCLASIMAMAQVNYGKLVPLHVDGNQFKDPFGNTVVLHGVMDTPSPYFNSYRWGNSCNDASVASCVNYFDKLFTAITDSTNGAYCNLFRLHLDPCWTNGNATTWKVDSREKGTGEADFSKYTPTRLTKYMRTLYWRIAQAGMKHGLYIIMRPPGVCPGTIYVGGSYQKYLMDVWDRVTKNDSILKYSGQISIELANEPIGVRMADGSESDQALHDFFQPIVDKIRENGFKGIVLVPGTGYQSNYRSYIKYPIIGDQIGFAVHNYAGWYGTSDDSYNSQTSIANFGNQVPVVFTNPIVITEVDWSPQNTSVIDHYNEFNQPVYKNYGTWATASTSKWGKAYKDILDYYGNISMTLTGTGDFIDIDDYIYRKKVTPAFKTKMEANGVDPYEACGVACFQWYKDYYTVNYAAAERYQPINEVPERPFELSKEWFIPNILYENSATHTATMSLLKMKANGFAGWRFTEEPGIDLSGYNYLVVKLMRNASKNTFFRIYDSANYWAEPCEFDMGNIKELKIDLHDLKTASGEILDPTHIRMAGFTTPVNDLSVYVKDVFLSIDGETEATAITAPVADTDQTDDAYYDLSGRRVTHPTKGIYIKGGKKILIK